MYFQEFNWWLTKHGRQRFIERVGEMPDSDILSTAIKGKEGYTFVWAPDRSYPTTGRRLITVLINTQSMLELPAKEEACYL
jgi:hypothetical protein